MDYVTYIENFFDMISVYIEKIKFFFSDSQFSKLLVYLFECIPEEMRIIFFIFILFLILVGFIKVFKE